MRFATIALLANCVGLAIGMLAKDQPLIAAKWLRYYWFRLADVVVPAAVALAAAGVALDLFKRGRLGARLVVATTVLACAGYMMLIAADRWRNPSPPAVARMEDVDAWLGACAWIREHAASDALCLIPRHAQSFKWYAQRADVVNWKDVPQDALGVIAWHRRIHDVFPTVTTPDGPRALNSPEQWGAARALDVARRYGAAYVVARSEPPLGLREVYARASQGSAGGYSVYEVEPASANLPRGEKP
jgi:hypothetical protein